MSAKILPEVYHPIFPGIEAQIAIKLIKDTFERKLAEKLNLIRVSAPLMVQADTGINDMLNGYERPVEFEVKETHKKMQIIQSLAKWKRIALIKISSVILNTSYISSTVFFKKSIVRSSLFIIFSQSH